MPVTTEEARNDYIGNGTVATYSFTFPVLGVDDFNVYRTDISGNLVTLARGADYTVALDSVTRIGSITLTAGALVSGYKLAIVDDQPLTQLVTLTNSNKYPPATVERALDRIAMQLRTLKEGLRHCVKLPLTENITATELPLLASRANRQLAFDIAGQPTTLGTAPLTGIIVSAYAETLLNDLSATEARTTLGLGSLATASQVTQATLAADVQYRVDTIAALKALVTTYATVEVLGYYAAGDGGGGTFRWNGADVTADNGGTVIIPNSGGTGRWNRIFSGAVNVRWFGAKGDNPTTDDRTAIVSAMAHLATLGGALYFPPGNYRVTAAIAVPVNVYCFGDGELVSRVTASAAFTLFTITGRNGFTSMGLNGTAKAGVGIDFGGTDFSGQNVIDRCRITGFATGMKMSGALWTTIRDCTIIANLVGMDFNAFGPAGYSTTVELINNRIASNDRQGIASTYTPILCENIAIRGGSIEENCITNPTTYSQCELTGMNNVKLDGVYLEYLTGGTKPTAVRLSGASYVDISGCYVNGSNIGVSSETNVVDRVKISKCRFIATTTSDVKIIGGANATRIILEHNSGSASNNLSVASNNLTNIDKAIPEWANQQTAFTPTLVGASVAGSPTYTVQAGFYSRVGNMVFVQGRVTISAKGGMSGFVSVRGLPVASANPGFSNAVIAVQNDGVTVSAGNTQFSGLVPPNTSQIDLYQEGSASAVNLVDSQFAASSTVIFSGWYSA